MEISRRQKNYTQNEHQEKYIIVFEYKDNQVKRLFIKEHYRHPMSYKDAINNAKHLSIFNPEMRFYLAEIKEVIVCDNKICPNCGVEIS